MDSHLDTWSLAGRTVWERLEDVDLFGASKLLLFQDLLSFMVSIGISLSLSLSAPHDSGSVCDLSGFPSFCQHGL